MVNPLNIYSTVSEQETFIGVNNKFIGKVNSYQHYITRFFLTSFLGKLLGISISVSIGGKVRCLNKKSYIKLVNSLLANEKVDKKTVENYSSFDEVVKKADLSNKKTQMRHEISAKKSYLLFKKLEKAILRNETEQAVKLIGKGASLDHKITYEFSVSTEWRDMNYPEPNRDKYIQIWKVFKGIPLLLATRFQNQIIKDKILEYMDLSATKETNLIANEYDRQKTRYERKENVTVPAYDGYGGYYMDRFETETRYYDDGVELNDSNHINWKFNPATKELDRIS